MADYIPIDRMTVTGSEKGALGEVLLVMSDGYTSAEGDLNIVIEFYIPSDETGTGGSSAELLKGKRALRPKSGHKATVDAQVWVDALGTVQRHNCVFRDYVGADTCVPKATTTDEDRVLVVFHEFPEVIYAFAGLHKEKGHRPASGRKRFVTVHHWEDMSYSTLAQEQLSSEAQTK